MIASIATGNTTIENLSEGADVKSTMACMQELGVQISRERGVVKVHGGGLYGLKQPTHRLNVGNSGTTIRLLSGILAGQRFTSRLTGDESIQRRPMARIFEPLTQMGARISSSRDQFAPFAITGGRLRALDYSLPLASAQVKSCILLAALYAGGRTRVHEPTATRDHTELMLAQFGASIQRRDLIVTIEAGPRLTGPDILFVPGDISSAAFFIAAALLAEDGGLLIKNVGINPTRRVLLSVLADMGANIDIMNVRTLDNEMMADLYVKNSDLKSIRIDGRVVPQIIDEIPILAVMATQIDGTTEIVDAGELRHKESDRIRSLKFNLDRMGAKIIEKEDGLVIEGPTRLKGSEVESFGDHRIAMAFAVAGLVAEGETKVNGSECANISYPGFYTILRELAGI